MSQQQTSLDSQRSSQLGNSQQPQTGTQQWSQSGGQQASTAATAGGSSGQVYRTRNVLPQEVRNASIAALEQCLADVTVLESQLKAAHWNVKGPTFYQLHELFEDVAEMLSEYKDEIAERLTALGGHAHGTVPQAARQTNVPRLPPTVADSDAMLESVASSLAAFDETLYQQLQRVSDLNDLDTADLLNEVSREVSKSLWFVEAHLQRGASPFGAQQQQQAASGGVQQQQSLQR